MGWLTVANLINVIVVIVAYSIRNELHHIRESIDRARKMAGRAEQVALKAHDRIDFLIKHGLHE